MNASLAVKVLGAVVFVFGGYLLWKLPGVIITLGLALMLVG